MLNFHKLISITIMASGAVGPVGPGFSRSGRYPTPGTVYQPGHTEMGMPYCTNTLEWKEFEVRVAMRVERECAVRTCFSMYLK